MDTLRALRIRVNELQLERERLHDARASRDDLERNRAELVRAQHALAVALGLVHSVRAA